MPSAASSPPAVTIAAWDVRRDSLSPDSLRERLRDVRWIGGASGAGKTAVSRRLSAGGGIIEYSTDDKIREHARRADPSETPLLAAFLAMDMDERWVTRPPREMFETFPWFQGEGFGLIVDDLLALPKGTPILAEGFRLLPRLVAPLLSHPNRAIWMVPTEDFRRRTFMARGSEWFPHETTDPERAMVNLLIRDRLFTDQVVKEAANLTLPILKVNGRKSLDTITRLVGERLELTSR